MANPIVQQINAELKELQGQLSTFYSNVEYLTNARESVKDAVIKVNHAEAHFNKKVTELKVAYDSIIRLKGDLELMFEKIDSVDFPSRLTAIENAVNSTVTSLDDTKAKTINELQIASKTILDADFKGGFNKLQSLVDEVIKENRKLSQELKVFEEEVTNSIKESSKEFEKNTKRISIETAKTISDLNIPIRIDKLDINISGVLTGIQNLQGRLDLVERNFSERIKESSDRQKLELSDLKKDVNSKIQNALGAISNLEKKLVAFEHSQNNKTFITWVILCLIFIAILVTKS
jgi:prefoldin subunit 5